MGVVSRVDLEGMFDGGRRRTKSNSLDEENLKARFLVLSCIFVENWSVCGTFISIVCLVFGHRT